MFQTLYLPHQPRILTHPTHPTHPNNPTNPSSDDYFSTRVRRNESLINAISLAHKNPLFPRNPLNPTKSRF
jgi:hypothetical protein